MMRKNLAGMTLIELVVVLLILSLLGTIATTVYTGQVRRAQFAAAKTEIRQLELNITRYEVDLGVFPPSSSGSTFGASAASPIQDQRFGSVKGCGYLTLCLQHSMSGNTWKSADSRWKGPYMEIQQNRLGAINGEPVSAGVPPPQISLLDPWGNPYYYTRYTDYENFGGTRQTNSPFGALGETYYNPTTFQIFSLGPDGTTPGNGNCGLGPDDLNNFDTATIAN